MIRPNLDLHIEKEDAKATKVVINGVDITNFGITFFVVQFKEGKWNWIYGNEKVETIDDIVKKYLENHQND